MERVYIAGSCVEVDGVVKFSSAPTVQELLSDSSLGVRKFTISPLSEGWATPLPADHFRSGNAPLEALEAAMSLLRGGEAGLVMIEGTDHLRSAYTSRERTEAMAIYPEVASIAHGYELLALRYMERRGIDVPAFLRLRDALYDNYARTFLSAPLSPSLSGKRQALPPPARHEPLTKLFRGVDCANPVVDFSGSLLVGTEHAVRRLGLVPSSLVEVAGVGTAATDHDGPKAVDEIALFAHLQKALEGAQAMAGGVSIPELFMGGEALLETYTCFPVIPLAFLLESGICSDVEGVEELLAERGVTITGGMNLARGPWNNPALHGLIAMHHALGAAKDAPPYGIVHSNGGLGYKQGVAILRRIQLAGH